METTLVRAADLPPTDAETGTRLIREQRQALAAEVANLAPEQWHSSTVCDRWTVRDIVAHVFAAAEDQAQPWRAVAGMIRGRFRYPGDTTLDALNQVGIDRRRDVAPERLVADLRRLAASSRTPGWFRRVPLGGGNGLPSDTTGAYLGHVIYVRDTWMHRHDIAHAVGATIAPEPGSAETVAQVVRDLGRFWDGPDLVLTLTGLGSAPTQPCRSSAPARRSRSSRATPC